MIEGAALVVLLFAFNLALQPVDAPFSLVLACVSVVAIGGAIGGSVYYATDSLRARGRAYKTLANVASLLAYAFFVLGAFLAAAAWLTRSH